MIINLKYNNNNIIIIINIAISPSSFSHLNRFIQTFQLKNS
jgi:hypothetical protein